MDNRLIKRHIQVSNADPHESTALAASFSALYRDVKLNHGKCLEYSSMYLDSSLPGVVHFSMIPCITKIIDEFQDNDR